MKIAIFSDNFYPELSGISDSIILLAGGLSKLGHKVDFYVPEYRAKDYRRGEKELKLGENIRINRLFSLPALLAGDKARLILPSFFRPSYKNFKPDIIHSQLFFGAGLEALSLAKFFKKPIIGTNHTAITEFVKGIPAMPGVFKKPSLKYAVWYYNCCDFVTAPSRSVFAEMSRYGFKRSHLIISNPIDTKTFRPLPDKSKFKKQFKLSDNAIVYAGRLSREKNIEVIIRAVALAKKKIKDITLAIAGDGKARTELEGLVNKLGLEQEVKFLGSLTHKKINELYAAAEVFAIASTSETQSLVLMHALASGLPAVAVKARALPEYVNEKNGYLVKPGDEKAMAEKFVLLLRDKTLRQKLGGGATVFVKQFSAENVAKQWEKLYAKVIDDYGKKT